MRVVVALESCICCIGSRPLRRLGSGGRHPAFVQSFPEIDDQIESQLSRFKVTSLGLHFGPPPFCVKSSIGTVIIVYIVAWYQTAFLCQALVFRCESEVLARAI